MLTRQREPEAMDSPVEVAAYDLMDHSRVNTQFVADFLHAHGPCRGGEVVDVGTGPARIPIVLCYADPKARVVGLDVAGPMLERARANIMAAALEHRIRLIEDDAKAPRLQSARFEAVLSNAALHHFADPERALAEMVRMVEPAGTVFVRDLARPSDLDTLERLVAQYAGDASDEAKKLFAASFHAALRPEEVREIVTGLGLPGEGIAMSSDRHWTWSFQRPA